MPDHASVRDTLARNILQSLEGLLIEAEQQQRPLELEPYRGQLFELFVTAEAAGYLEEDSEPDLSADGICREIAARWGLADATREAISRQSKLPPEQLSRMRILWSVMRLWMEWDYAWSRWHEFHDQQENQAGSDEEE